MPRGETFLREFLQLAKVYEPGKHGIGGWYVSEKLDGQRCYWDGGITRGIGFQEIPWGNQARDDRNHICTGLWSRLGKPIFAPEWFLDKMPEMMPLDGELYVRGMSRQELRSIISRHVPDVLDWMQVKYYVFDSPRYERVFMEGEIRNPLFKKVIGKECMDKVKELTAHYGSPYTPLRDRDFMQSYAFLERQNFTDPIVLHQQKRLPFSQNMAEIAVEEGLQAVAAANGEGLMVRKPEAFWIPRRCDHILKVKGYHDAEGTVIGYYWAEQGKIYGKMGALILDYKGREMAISGFTDAEREMSAFDADAAPGSRVKEGFYNPTFPIGTVVTFKYQDLSDDGIPNHARYFRKYDGN